jgi:HK97 gp10 family phage protein
MGVGSLKQRFGALKSGMETRTSRAMVVAAGGVLKRKAKAIALANGSRRTGAMIKNIAIKREPQAPAGTAQYNLGVRNGGELTKKQKSAGKRLAVNGAGRVVTRYKDDPYYWKWVEQGHKIVTSKTPGKTARARRTAAAGNVAAKPFIGPALEQGRTEAIDAMSARLQKDLEKAGAA